MTVSLRPLRVVLDTNVLVAILAYDDPALEPLRRAWQDGALGPLIDTACRAEFERVLAYPQLAERARTARSSFEEFLSRCERVPDDAPMIERLPSCRDADDQKFLALTSRGQADALLTRDRLLLDLDRAAPFAIIRPEALATRLAQGFDLDQYAARSRHLR